MYRYTLLEGDRGSETYDGREALFAAHPELDEVAWYAAVDAAEETGRATITDGGQVLVAVEV